MRYFIAVLALALSLSCFAYAEEEAAEHALPDPTADEFVALKCPMKWMFKSLDDEADCKTCHTFNPWGLKETDPFAEYDPPYNVDILWRDGEPVVYNKVTNIAPEEVWGMFEWANRHPELNKVIIEVSSYGGSLFDGWRYVGVIEQWYDRFEIETHLLGYAMSCGFLIFEAGETRLVSPRATGMWHEFRSFAMFQVKTPSGIEDEAEEMRIIQNNVNEYLASRSCRDGVCLSVEDIHKEVNKRNWWLNGSDMIELGFADGYIK
jgi:ATP-dependent protease ClpP protease subunit